MSDQSQLTELTFGPGLDRETGSQAVNPTTHRDLRNVYHHEGSLAIRKGVFEAIEFKNSAGNNCTHILNGIAIRSERIGIVVAYEKDTTGEVNVYRMDAAGTIGVRIGTWFTLAPGAEVPVIILAEVKNRVFMAHDERFVSKRQQTFVYDPIKGNVLTGLEADFLFADTPQPIKFRGVVRHLEYLFGWGFGDENEERPEMVRSSLPGEPEKFDVDHYFIAGDRRDPVIVAQPAADTLLVFKESETHEIVGFSRATFGIRANDDTYGCLGSRLAVRYIRNVFAWTAEGPRLFSSGESSFNLNLALDLDDFESGEFGIRLPKRLAFADYISGIRNQLIYFCFGQQLYVYSLRNDRNPRWTYWLFPFHSLCGFRLFGADETIGVTPVGHPEFNALVQRITNALVIPAVDSTIIADHVLDLTIDNINQVGTEFVEVWMRPLTTLLEADLITDEFEDLDADGLGDAWTQSSTIAAGATAQVDTTTDGTKGVQILRIFGPLVATNFLDIRQDVAGVLPGEVYRYEMAMKHLEFTASASAFVEWFDGADVAISSTALIGKRDPDWFYVAQEVTAPALTAKARLHIRVTADAAGESLFVHIKDVSFQRFRTADQTDWAKLIRVPVGGQATQTIKGLPVAISGMSHRLAMRYVNVLGQATVGYTDEADIDNWPAASLNDFITSLVRPQLAQIDWVRQDVSFSSQHFRGLSPHSMSTDLEMYRDAVLEHTVSRKNIQYKSQFATVGEDHAFKSRYVGRDTESPFTVHGDLFGSTAATPPILVSVVDDGGQLYTVIWQTTPPAIAGDPRRIEIYDNYDNAGGLGPMTLRYPKLGNPDVPPTIQFKQITLDVNASGLSIDVRVRMTVCFFFAPVPCTGDPGPFSNTIVQTPIA